MKATFFRQLVLASALAAAPIFPASAQTLFALTFPLPMEYWTSPPAVYSAPPFGHIDYGMHLCATGVDVPVRNLKYRQLVIGNGKNIYILTTEGYPGGVRDPANDQKCRKNAALYAKQSNAQYANVFGPAEKGASPHPDAGGTATANSSPAPAAQPPQTFLCPAPSNPFGTPEADAAQRAAYLKCLKDGGAAAGSEAERQLREAAAASQPAQEIEPQQPTCSMKDLHDHGPRPDLASPLSRQVSDTYRALMVSQFIQLNNMQLVQSMVKIFGDASSGDPNSCKNVREAQESIDSTKVNVSDINKLADGEYRAIVTFYMDGKPETQKIGFLRGDDGLTITCYPSGDGKKDC